ncbi:4-hydroxy-tetrahydrodipicolinate synthase [Pikeienuella piscinae]|uniref:4-hydroxy-tetrahydrodipicolinate synthase n=1 Tax=Pikeienuella piscinae TaxID=2748098 RepID=A0A7M3T567_9RHOB|nr:4-hydroxy-tetrahydrodipicolinate synthase [Pikeienuella piscinae]QIE57148.1 4-hydroxy-tetrahydrodipicolinate synthase [Pikeienuella piscinae]
MFRGSLPALVTPFRDGAVDEKTLIELVEWHIDEGSHGLVPVGTTGESPTLSHQEHEHVIELVVKTAAKRVPVIAGAGSNNTDEAIRFVTFAKKVGADGALVVTPYYNKPTQRGLYAHFKALNDCADIPIIIYNIPSRSVIDMTPATMGDLAKLKNIVGVKDATGDVSRVSDQRATCGHDFIQLTGEDPSALGHWSQGGVGCISVTANVAPRACAEFQDALAAGERDRALAMQDRLLPLHRAIFLEPGVVGAKTGLSLLGKCSDEVRSPITPALPETKEAIRSAMVHAGILNG